MTEHEQPDTAAAFRHLARRFAAAATDAQAHELFSAAFGLQPARHAHLTHIDDELISSARSWAEAPPVKVPPHLRKIDKDYLGTVGKVRDVEPLRRKRKADERRELTDSGPIRISTLGQLDDDTLRELLDVIGRALGNKPDDTGTRTAVHGHVEVSLRVAGGVATIETPSGTFTGPDFLIDVRRSGER
ncbi:DUF2397 family protein [Lentzea tibetensis]|uniref:DUF2397 family protein n=1 Tax=Lentzea tibetensis TaxID=2591470 RepID=UPI0016491BE4|nr:DUF2397 family protein [Lentzea tibetensis]